MVSVPALTPEASRQIWPRSISATVMPPRAANSATVDAVHAAADDDEIVTCAS